MTDTNPLLSDRDVAFLLFECFDAEALCKLPHFADHSRETFELYLSAVRAFARESMFPAYKPMDEAPAHFIKDRVETHPLMKRLWPELVGLGLLNATRPVEVDGQQLPLTVSAPASAYVMAANCAAYGFVMLTQGSAHLIEAFGSDELRETYMRAMYSGRFSGTMALTEPQAGSSLADVQTRATPTADGHYLIQGSKVFISNGDNTFTENIVHLLLARIDGAPAGIRGVSLFVVPKLRPDGAGGWVPNDAQAAGAFHKLGYRGIPSIALNLGERGGCHGYLVGKPNQGIAYMFQMMNEARIHIGIHGVASAAVAYHEALRYARDRPQGRQGGGPDSPQLPIIEHADVRRMLLRQKAIVEGGLSLCVEASRHADLSEHGLDDAQRERSRQMLELLTPMVKTFPAERGFEANVLSVQVHGGYGYTSEYLPEAWLRDQKLNSIHEGTTGIQSQDLLGRKVLKDGGAGVAVLAAEVRAVCAVARAAGLDGEAAQVERALATTEALVQRLLQGNPTQALSHAWDFMDLMCTLVIGWQWLRMAATAARALPDASEADQAFYRGKLQAAGYWLATELPRIPQLAELCANGEDSYVAMQSDWY